MSFGREKTLKPLFNGSKSSSMSVGRNGRPNGLIRGRMGWFKSNFSIKRRGGIGG